MFTIRGGSFLFSGTRAAEADAPAAGSFSALERVRALLSRSLGTAPAEGPHAHISWSPVQRRSLHERWGEAALAELEALGGESDPELFYQSLLGLARSLEGEGKVEAAAEVYAAVVQEADAAGARREGPLRMRAQAGLDAILGRGAFGPRAEFLLRDLARQSSDPAMLFAMGTAGAVFRMTRIMTLSRLVARPQAGFLTQLLGTGRLASLAGFALEAPAFTLAARLGNEALGRSQEWDSRALGRDVASSYLVLGGMKLAGWGSGAAYRRIANPVGGLRERPLQLLFQQGGMLGGILLGHSLEEHFGLRPRRDGATTLTDSLAMLLQFHVAGRLTRRAFGPRFAAWEARMDLQAAALAAPRPAGPRGPFGEGGFGVPRPALETAGLRAPRLPPAEVPNIFMMAGRGRGGRSSGSVVLPAEVLYWLSQVEHENSAVGIAATARLQDMLRNGEGLSPRQYTEVFRQLYRKLDTNIEVETYDLIVDGLNELLTRIPVREPGPRALFREMTRPELAEELIVPGFYASWMKNPSLSRAGRGRIVERVVEILRRKDLENDVPHDQALTLLNEVWNLPQLEPAHFQTLVREAVRFAGRNDGWFNGFEGSLPLARLLLSDGRVPGELQVDLLKTQRAGLRDTDLRSQTRVEILEHLEATAASPRSAEPAREWLRRELPGIRQAFLKENLEELRQYGRRFLNFAELGYLLSRDYVDPDVKALLGQELFRAFRDYPSSSMGYDHLLAVAHEYANNAAVPAEARFHLWSMLLKGARDLAPDRLPPENAGYRLEQWPQVLASTLARMPRPEREALATAWIQRMTQGPVEQRRFAAGILEALLPYLEPNFDLRARLEAAAEGNLLEVRATVNRVLSRWNQVN